MRQVSSYALGGDGPRTPGPSRKRSARARFRAAEAARLGTAAVAAVRASWRRQALVAPLADTGHVPVRPPTPRRWRPPPRQTSLRSGLLHPAWRPCRVGPQHACGCAVGRRRPKPLQQRRTAGSAETETDARSRGPPALTPSISQWPSTPELGRTTSGARLCFVLERAPLGRGERASTRPASPPTPPPGEDAAGAPRCSRFERGERCAERPLSAAVGAAGRPRLRAPPLIASHPATRLVARLLRPLQHRETCGPGTSAL